MGSLSRASADCTLNPANMKDWERLIPAANMGEYEPPRERPEDGGLYPLNAEVANTIIMTMMMVMVVMVIMTSQTISREPMVECQKTGTLADGKSCPSIRSGRRNPNYTQAMPSVTSVNFTLWCWIST